MQLTLPKSVPFGTALTEWATCAMDVILHLGAHRTAATSFQCYMQRLSVPLAEHGMSYWGPMRTRSGEFIGSVPSGEAGQINPTLAKTTRSRITKRLEEEKQRGVQTMIVSDQNMLGCLAENISSRMLYPDAAARMARFAKAFDGRLSAVVISPRSLEYYWCSALARGLVLGQDVPERSALRDIAMGARGWRDVIFDVATAMPGVPLLVLPFERFVGQPDAFLAAATGAQTPFDTERSWLNRAPSLPELRRVLKDRGGVPVELPFGMGRWNPFTNEENAALRELYADDMMWLTAGADGKATLIEDSLQYRAGQTPPLGGIKKGQADEHEERQLARPG